MPTVTSRYTDLLGRIDALKFGDLEPNLRKILFDVSEELRLLEQDDLSKERVLISLKCGCRETFRIRNQRTIVVYTCGHHQAQGRAIDEMQRIPYDGQSATFALNDAKDTLKREGIIEVSHGGSI